MLKILLALAALYSLSEARKRRRVRSGSGRTDCYDYSDYYTNGHWYTYYGNYYWYTCPPAEPAPGKDPNNCNERSYAFADSMWLKADIEEQIEGACPDGRITEITAGPPALVNPGPVTTLQRGKEPVTPEPRMKPGATPGAKPGKGGKPGAKPKPGTQPGAKRGPQREAGQIIDVAAQTMVRAGANDECGTDLSDGERLACFKCAHNHMHTADVSQCDYRRASHIQRLESLHRRWEQLVLLDVRQYQYCDGLHNDLDAVNAALAEDPSFCAECAQSDYNGFCSAV